MNKCLSRLLQFALLMCLLSPAVGKLLRIEKLEPSPFFPQVEESRPIKQLVRLYLQNDGKSPIAAAARIRVATDQPYEIDLDNVPAGNSAHWIEITDIADSAEVTIQVKGKESGQVLAEKKFDWTPQKNGAFFRWHTAITITATAAIRTVCVRKTGTRTSLGRFASVRKPPTGTKPANFVIQ